MFGAGKAGILSPWIQLPEVIELTSSIDLPVYDKQSSTNIYERLLKILLPLSIQLGFHYKRSIALQDKAPQRSNALERNNNHACSTYGPAGRLQG